MVLLPGRCPGSARPGELCAPALAQHKRVPEVSGDEAGSGGNELPLPGWIHDWANPRGGWSPSGRAVQDKPFPWSVLQALRERESDSTDGIREGYVGESAFELELEAGISGGGRREDFRE